MVRFNGSRRTRTFDDSATLIGTVTTYDEYKQPIVTETRTPVLCDIESVGRDEFYRAGAVTMKPSKVFVVNSFEYRGEKLLEHAGVRYSIIRDYEVDDNLTELTCEMKTGTKK